MEEQAKIMTLRDHDTGEAIAPRTVIKALSGEGKKGQIVGFTEDNTVGLLDGGSSSAISNNRNLIINSNFEFPINQRGQKSYDLRNKSPRWSYTIDGWCIDNLLLTIEDDGWIKLTAPTDSDGAFFQGVEVDRFYDGLVGRTVTASVLYRSDSSANALYYFTIAPGYIEGCPASVYMKGDNEPDVITLPYTIPPDKPIQRLDPVSIKVAAGTTVYVKAGKWELGDKQTLAHQDENGEWVLNDPPPDPTIELLKCQRYFQVFKTSSLRPSSLDPADFRPEMRERPTTSTISIGGTTYYTADAELY